jgi:stringent starvation protein B
LRTEAVNSSRPYLLRALYEWILDNGMTPHIMVDVERSGFGFPPELVADGRIVLNVSPQAVRELLIGSNEVSFRTRFAGRSSEVRVPPGAVLAIYARENGKGMMFPEEDIAAAAESGRTPPGRPDLKLVR